MDPNFSFQYIYYDIDGQFLYDFVLLLRIMINTFLWKHLAPKTK